MHWAAAPRAHDESRSFFATRSYRALVVGVALAVVCLYAPMAGFGWLGGTGYEVTVNPAGVVVRAGPHAAAAGVRVGDAVDPGPMPIVDRLALLLPPAGRHQPVTLRRDGRSVHADLVAFRFLPPSAVRWPFALSIAATCAFVVLGALVALRRPGPMGLWFFLFSCGFLPAGGVLVYGGSPPWFAAALLIYRYFMVAGFYAYPLIPFMLRFPDGELSGWRRRLGGWSTALLLVGVVYAAGHTIASARVGFSMVVPDWIGFLANFPLVAAVGLLWAQYAYGDATARTRSTWASLAFAALIASGLAFAYLRVVSFVFALWVFDAGTILALAAFGIAILRQHVFDISFSINRALVYGALTSVLVGTVALLDWMLGRMLSSTKLASALEAVATVALGYALNAMHARIERGVEALLFRQRRETERFVRRLADSLPFALTPEAVDEAVVHDAARELRLAYAALFRGNGAGSYECVASFGAWPPAFRTLADDDVIVRFLRHQRRATRLSETRRPAGEAFQPDAPVVAVPLTLRHELAGVAFYGPHADGLAIDPEELELLESLAAAAAVTYAAIEARQTREELAALRLRFAAHAVAE